MDVLEQRCRRAGRSYDGSNSSQPDVNLEQEAALSQGGALVRSGQDLVGPSGVGAGQYAGGVQPSASPTAMEAGLGGTRASPFHSEKVRGKVELMKKRPLTLDADAEALRREKQDVFDGQGEYDYRARVARVQSSDQDPEAQGSGTLQATGGLTGRHSGMETQDSPHLNGFIQV